MSKRQIIKINEELCNGCGVCIPGCPEGAIQIIDEKARLVSDLFCDGLGACIGNCPRNAITVLERKAEPYNERLVMENVVRQGENVIKAHLRHLKDHKQDDFLEEAILFLKEKNIKIPNEKDELKSNKCSSSQKCPGSRMMNLLETKNSKPDENTAAQKSELMQWPVQLHLLNPEAPYFKNAELLVAADCVGFSCPNFHRDLLKGKILVIFCPKLDSSIENYIEKLTQIFKNQNIKSITAAHMEVPCCGGTSRIVNMALKNSGREIPVEDITISIKGEILERR